MKVAIVTNGQVNDLCFIKEQLEKVDHIICADGAARYMMDLNIIPHQLVGDLDSIEENILNWAKEQKIAINRFPKRKDQTDTELAVEYAFQKEPSEIMILGALGGRVDHSLANIFLLVKMLDNGIVGRILDEQNEITIVKDHIQEQGSPGENLSIIPIGGVARGVTLKGLEYPLKERNIPMGSSLGISNQFKESKADISINEGLLLVIKSKE